MSFNVSYPTFIIQTFNPLRDVGQSSEMIVSFDCFLENTNLNIFNSSRFIFKCFISAFFPFILILFFTILSVLVKLFLWKWVILIRLIVISVLTILFTMYSSTSQLIVSIFNCKEIESETYLEWDLELKCWDSSHFRWAFGFGIPFIILFIFGLPVLGIVFLRLWRKHLNDINFMKYFIVMY